MSDPKEDDIDKLLDSTLQDFDKKKAKKKKAKPATKPQSPEEDLLTAFSKAGFAEKCSLQDLNDQLTNLSLLEANGSQAASTSHQGGGSNDAVGMASLQDTLLKLTQDTQKLNEMPTDEDMERMFQGMSSDNIEKDLGSLLPMMEGMMQSLLSKELLYPAIKDMNAQFPAWLEENKTKISQPEYENFESQYDITQKICAHFEKDDIGGTDEGKKENFQKILTLMEEMQKLGHPPKDLVGDAGLPAFPGGAGGSPDQCSIS
eukprot:TRINITY_DN20191_c0_g1_i1.p1 TRINITY_DN20191_c0_g1~~TRINITY_DN20191_c0_g1_i1.p1  ORF type:complete len:260 (+),score=81.69 TRINITY_DN20191_c0_g1_i1:82-861(+)